MTVNSIAGHHQVVCATLIGDLIGSRLAPQRDSLQRSVDRALRLVNEAIESLQPLQPTLGDEFQGAYAGVASAVRASLLVRLHLLEDAEVDTRFGLGLGPVTVFDEERVPLSQDGPGWWSARNAIQSSLDLESRPHTKYVRTRFERSDRGERTEVVGGEIVNAYLTCRDAIVAEMDPRSRRLLLGHMLGRKQADLAAEEGISQSAVSQNLATSGAYPIAVADEELARALS